MSAHISNVRPAPDQVIVDIANYVADYKIDSTEAYDTARNCLMDTLGCGFEALEWCQSTWHHVSVGSNISCLQHRRHDTLVGF
jgi:2-methylcitrate dehydratase PrpD